MHTACHTAEQQHGAHPPRHPHHRLGHSKPDSIDHADFAGATHHRHEDSADDAGARHLPTPDELRTALAAVVRRGAPLQTLRVRFLEPAGEDGHQPMQEREQQLLAVLEALCRSPIKALTMSGAVPLRGAIASAVASCLPSLTDLALLFRWEENDLPHGDPSAEPASQYYHGAMQLLTLCGPRLKELRLCGGVGHWPAMTFQALRCCGALTLLEVEGGRLDEDGGQQHGPHLGSFAHEDSILGPIARLTSLRSLYLNTVVDPDICAPSRPGAVHHVTGSPQRPHRPDTPGARPVPMLRDPRRQLEETPRHGEEDEALGQLQEEHRTSLFSALRAMPQLQHLDCPALWLKAAEAATLSALTSMRIAGLLPPPASGEDSSGSSSRSNSSSMCPLPPQLAELSLDSAGSPRALASLQVPTTLTALHLWRLRFGMSDVTPDRRLSPQAVEAMGPALQLIRTLRTA